MPSIEAIVFAVSILSELTQYIEIEGIHISSRIVDMGTTNKTGKAKEIKILINDWKGKE